MVKLYLAPFIVAALLAGALTFYTKKIAEKLKIVDEPGPRKIHTKPIPRLGGVAIFVAFLVLVLGYNLISHRLDFSFFKFWLFDKRLIGVIFGALVLVVVGIIDDARNLRPWQKLVAQIFAASTVVMFGLSIDYIRLPWGYHIDLNQWIVPLNLFGYGFQFVVWGDLLTVFWLVLMINTINFLDGLDGLAGGITFIAAVAIFFLSLSLGQTAGALLAVILAGATLGFLPWNFNPAKIFMGDAGSMSLGYLLGVLAIISGGKLATAFLVMGLPMLDVAWVIMRRLASGKSPFKADKMHLHHRLLALGFTQRQTAFVLYFISAAFGIIAIMTDTQGKVKAVWWLLGLMLALVVALVVLEWRRRKREVQI